MGLISSLFGNAKQSLKQKAVEIKMEEELRAQMQRERQEFKEKVVLASEEMFGPKLLEAHAQGRGEKEEERIRAEGVSYVKTKMAEFDALAEKSIQEALPNAVEEAMRQINEIPRH